MKQEEITKWERKNQPNIVSWTIDYEDEKDIVTFVMKDKSKVKFEREKEV